MLHDSSVLEKLHLTLAEADDSSIPPEEEITLERFYSYVLELASARSWSQSLYSTCLPNFFAGIFHEKQALRDTCMTRVKELWKCVLEAEAFVRNPREDAAVRQAVAGILADMAWNRLQISRELLAVIRQGQYDTSDYETRRLAFLLFGTHANTKFCLEDKFGHLADLSARGARQSKMSKLPGPAWTACLIVQCIFTSVLYCLRFVT